VGAGRGEKPNMRRAFSDVRSFLRPSSGVSILSCGMNKDSALTTTSGNRRVGTFLARAPSPDRNVRAISSIHMKSPAAMKRSKADSRRTRIGVFSAGPKAMGVNDGFVSNAQDL